MEKPQQYSGIEAFSEVERAIVVCAHADDMETIMGGTISLLAARGVEIFEVICTLGDIGSNDERYTRDTLAAVRREEARDAGRMLGLIEVVTLDYHDGELEPTLELRAQLVSYYRAWQPDTLFTFDPTWPGQIHPDHRASGRAAVDALMPSRQRLYRPEQLATAKLAAITSAFLFSPTQPDVFVDVTGVYDRKVAASIAHKSQFPEGDKNLDWMRRLDTAAAEQIGLQDHNVEQFCTLRLW